MVLLVSTSMEDTSLNIRENVLITVVVGDIPDAVLLVVDGVSQRLFERRPNTSTYQLLLFGLELMPGVHTIAVSAHKVSTIEVETMAVGNLTLVNADYIIPADMVEVLIRSAWSTATYGPIPNIIKVYEQKSFDTEWEGDYILLRQGTTVRKPHAQRNYATEMCPVNIMIRCSGTDEGAEERAYKTWRGVLNSLELTWNNIPYHLWGYLAFEDSGANESDELTKVWSFNIRTALVDEWRRVGIPQ